MTVNIRDGVFETNSSSSHSVTVVPEEIVDFGLSKETLRDGKIRVELDGFGSSWHRYYKPENKIAYLVAYVADADFLSELPDGENASFALRKHSRHLDRLIAGVERRTGCVLEIIGGNYPYVDHQALETGVADDLLKNTKAMLDFVLSNSYVQTGSDEYTANEFIETDRGPEPAYPSYMVDSGIDECTFGMEFHPDDEKKIVLVEDGRETVVVHPGFATWGIFEAMRGTTVTGISVGDDRDGQPADQRARDAAFHYLAYVNQRKAEPRLVLMKDAPITGIARGRSHLDEYDLPYRISCIAPAHTLEAIKEALSNPLLQAPAPRR